jgi:hypothetical protein
MLPAYPTIQIVRSTDLQGLTQSRDAKTKVEYFRGYVLPPALVKTSFAHWFLVSSLDHKRGVSYVVSMFRDKKKILTSRIDDGIQ